MIAAPSREPPASVPARLAAGGSRLNRSTLSHVDKSRNQRPPRRSPRMARRIALLGLIFLHDQEAARFAIRLKQRPGSNGNESHACVPSAARSVVGLPLRLFSIRSLSTERWSLDDAPTWCDNRWQLPPKAVALAGIGMGDRAPAAGVQASRAIPDRRGGSMQCASIITSSTEPARLWTTCTPAASNAGARHGNSPLHPVRQPAFIAFAADPDSRWFRGNDRLHEKSDSRRVPHAFEPQGGHIVELLETLLVRAARAGCRLL